MRVPNADRAVVAVEKLVHYCLDQTNEVGQHKAKVFAAALGITQINFEILRTALIEAIKNNDATVGVSDDFGDRYIVDFGLELVEKRARIRSVWMIDRGKEIPRMISCYVIV